MGFLAFVLFVAVIVLAILLFKARKRVEENESKIRILNSSLATQVSKVTSLTSQLDREKQRTSGSTVVREAASKLAESVRPFSSPKATPKPTPARSKASSTPRPQSNRSSSYGRRSSNYDDNTSNAFLFGALVASTLDDSSSSNSSSSSSYDSGSSYGSGSSYSSSSSSSYDSGSSSSSYSDSGSSYSDSGSF